MAPTQDEQDCLLQVDLRLLEQIQYPESLTFWALPGDALAANVASPRPLSDAVRNSFPPMLKATRTFQDLLKSTKDDSRSFMVLSDAHLALAQGYAAAKSQQFGDDWGYQSLEFLLGGCSAPEMRSFILSHRHSLQSLAIQISSECHEWFPIKYWQTLARFTELETFIYRTKAVGNYALVGDVLHVMAKSPNLKHLTVFQLWGTLHEPGPRDRHVASQLHSLHLRGLQLCREADLSELVANSHDSLKELTLVFDYQRDFKQSSALHRGISTVAVKNAFAPCLAIRALRIGDFVGDANRQPASSDTSPELDSTASNEPIPGSLTHSAAAGAPELIPEAELPPEITEQLDRDDSQLETLVDGMVRTLKGLRVLEVTGKVFSPALFKNLKLSGCQLSELSIYRYPGFPLGQLASQILANNPALVKLRTLTLGKSVLESPDLVDDLKKLQKACQERKIELAQLETF